MGIEAIASEEDVVPFEVRDLSICLFILLFCAALLLCFFALLFLYCFSRSAGDEEVPSINLPQSARYECYGQMPGREVSLRGGYFPGWSWWVLDEAEIWTIYCV
jgi:hypothetical protein